MTHKWVSVSDACVILKISKSTLYRRIKDGEIESKREGKLTMCLTDVPDESQNETSGTPNDTLQAIDHIRSENEHLRQQVAQLQGKLDQKDEDLRQKDEQMAEASHRHDTVVMQMTKMLEYHQQPFWQRWLKIKALPAPGDVMDMEPDTEEEATPEKN